jgi:peptidoglycan hydrolase-like protein with peptidoglycan-binding domain
MANIKKSKRFLNQRLLLPVVVVLVFASIGSYVIVKSQAATWAVYNISGAFGYNCPYYQPPTLQYGSTGGCVKVVQKGVDNWINLYNYFHGKVVYKTVTVDGIFGSATQTAVKQYQSNHNLTADGIVGQKTWTVMNGDCAFWGNCFATGK